MKHQFHLLSCCAMMVTMLSACFLDARPILSIYRTDRQPFQNDGQRNEAAWNQADTALDLINPHTAGVETFSTRAQLLYDSRNLYVSIRGSFNPLFRKDRTQKRGLFADNNFEFFIKGDGQDDFQVAISEGGLIHQGINGGKPTQIPGLRTAVRSHKDHWQASLVIPLESLGLKPQPQKLRFNICRFNIDLPQGKTQMASFMAISGSPNYHVVNQWPYAHMTDGPRKGRLIHADSDTIRINLIRDPGFDFITRSFDNPLIQRVETAPLSGIWLIRATGKAYHFFSSYVEGIIREGQDYTLRIRARRVGQGGSLGVLQLRRAPDGTYLEGTRPGWNIPLSGDFQYYNLPFKGDRDVLSLTFYNIGGSEGNGVEIENVSLFKGRISAFEIRQITRPGLKGVVPGTTPFRSHNIYGKSPQSIRILVIGSQLTSLADPMEIFSGMNVQADLLTTTGINTDVYYTFSKPQTIIGALKANAYDLIMIGGNEVPQKLGRELARQIQKNVLRGAALFLNSPQPYGNLTELINQAKLVPLSADHPLRQALPMAFFIQPAPWGTYSHKPLAAMKQGRLGRGRVITGLTSYCELPFQMIQDPTGNLGSLFPWATFNKAWLARLITYAAGRSDLSLKAMAAGHRATVSAKLPNGTRLAWKVMDKLGSTTDAGTALLTGGKASFPFKAPSLKGHALLMVHARNAAGQTLDYTTVTFNQAGPQIARLQDMKLYHRGDDKALVKVTLKDADAPLALTWSLEDFTGRIILRGTSPARQETILTIPLAKLFTNLGIAQVNLLRNGTPVDVRRIPLVAQDRDKKRVLDDFTPSIWNFGNDVPPELAEQSHRQLEKIGFRSYLLPFQGLATLKSGMTSGSMWRAAWIFWARRDWTSNIRPVQFNSAEGRKNILETARENALRERQIGIIQDTLADEPGIANANATNEMDEHPENVAEFRRRMQAKYGTIATYNRRMRSGHQDFHDIAPVHLADARKSGRFGEFIEWRNFNVDRWCEAIRLVADTTRKHDPNSCLSLANTFGESPFNGNDFWKLLTKAGLNFSHEYTSMVYQGGNPHFEFDDFYRSFRPDMRVWGYTGYFYTRGMAMFQPWWFALHRYGGFTWFATYACVGAGGGGSWLNILDNVSGAFTQDAQNIAESLRKSNLQRGLGKIFLDYRWARNDIAIYYSHDSYLLAYLRGKETGGEEIHATGPLHDMMYSRHRLGVTLQEMLYQYDYLAPEQIFQGKLGERKVLFLPGVHALSDREVKTILDYMANGGQVIADFLPGDCDELGNRRKANPFAGKRNLTVIGKCFEHKDMPLRKRLSKLLGKFNCPQVIGNQDAVTLHGREAVHVQKRNMHVFGILRDQGRSRDHLTQTFTFPVRGHLYDLRAGTYLGLTDTVTAAVPHGEASVWGIYPYQVRGIEIQAPGTIAGLEDFKATFSVKADTKPGHHVFHAELVAPHGECRFFMQRNLSAPDGTASMTIPMADSDRKGTWTLKVTDANTGVTEQHPFTLK